MDSSKSALRRKIRAARRDVTSRFTLELLKECAEYRRAKVVASYRSYGFEPETNEINQQIIGSGRTLLLPRMKPHGRLGFIIWDGDLSKLTLEGKVEEPTGPEFLGTIDLMIVPSLAADLLGNRLGQGGGYYDRALSNENAWKVTLLNEGEILEEIPSEPHDAKIDAILTPTRLIRT